MIGALINLIIWLLVVGILYGVVVYVVDAIPIPDPPARIIKLALVVLMALVVILFLLQIIGVQTGINVPKL